MRRALVSAVMVLTSVAVPIAVGPPIDAGPYTPPSGSTSVAFGQECATPYVPPPTSTTTTTTTTAPVQAVKADAVQATPAFTG